MILTLEVTSSSAAKLGGASRQTFQGEGGSIGRELDNSWVLPDPKVSGHHARISYRSGVYYIEDTSTNGTYRTNSSKDRLARGRPYALASGDRLLIDPYEIRVSIARDESAAVGRNVAGSSDVLSPAGRFDATDMDDPFAPQPFAGLELESGVEEGAGHTVDPLELLGLARRRAPVRKAPNVNDFERDSLLDAHYQPPAVMADPASAHPASRPRVDAISIPQDYDPLKDDSASFPQPSLSEPPDQRLATPPDEDRAAPPAMAPARVSAAAEGPAPVRERQPAAPAADVCATDLAAVLEGAGLNPADVTPELARSFGEILRVVVSGVIDVMQSRQLIKEEFGLRTTRVRRAENNPLKFSVDANDALHNLLVKRNPAYLAPVAAFEDAFADLRDHQMAMLAGMRVAFESMLAEFDPDRLQQEFDRRLKGLVPARRLRYWELYREKGHDIAKDREASFRRLFGEAFARAYDEQLNQLKAGSRARSAGRSSGPTPQESDT